MRYTVPDTYSETRSSSRIIGHLGLCLAAVLSFASVADAAPRPAADPLAGKQAYLDNCARCHGPAGAGDGRDATRMDPKPRILSEGVFKFRTTASGTPPTDEDLYHTVSEGLPGSRMPEFQRLDEDTRWQLVEYVKSLSPVFAEQKPEPLDLGTDPGPAKANLTRGEELYKQLGCNACHGDQGRGNGPSAPTLVDQWNKPIRAADLTLGWTYRGGSAPKDILARLMTGIDGTPMPSYAEAVSSAAEVWDLAYYVHSMQVEPQWGRAVKAAKAAGPLPVSADDPAWESAPRTDVRLSGLFYRGGELLPVTGHAISIQAMYNENEVAFRLRWNDPTESQENPPDAVELAFLADRRKKWEVGSLRSWPPAGAEASLLEVTRWSAGDAGAAASYANGEWAVVVKRPLPASKERSPLVGFMVWDGGNGEQGRHRAASPWLDLEL